MFIKTNKSIIINIFILTIFLADWKLTGYVDESKSLVVNYFSDILVILSLVLLLFSVKKIYKNNLIFISAIFLCFFINTIYQIIFNSDFNSTIGVISLAKIFIYCVYFIFLHSFIEEKNLQKSIIIKLVKYATFFSVIGIIIYLIQVFKIQININFLWKFLRQDENSYLLGSSDLVRLRGLTNEPAHFGIINCFVLVVAYFNKLDYEIPKINNVILILSTILSFSLSSFPLLFGIVIVQFFRNSNFKFLKRISTYITALIGVGVLYYLKDKIYQAIIVRLYRVQNKRDNSATMRLSGSWDFALDKPVFGYGVGNSPELLFNNYAYIFTELGIFTFSLSIIFTISLAYFNIFYGIYFIYFMFQQGGYLSVQFWSMTMILIITANKKKTTRN